MIYVISKETYGQYEVRDIQCNANWDCCPYSEYALIPENLLGDILATQGYCDIVLNDAGNEVVSFTAREIPSVPDECCGMNTVLSVNGVKANSNGELTLTHNDVGAVSRTLVWENPATGEDQQFVTQRIDFTPDVEYDGFEIVYHDFVLGGNDTLYSTGYLPVVASGRYKLTANGYGTATGVYHRNVYYVRNGNLDSLLFDDAYYRAPDTLGTGEKDNFCILPYRIYGIKGVRNADDPDPGSGGEVDPGSGSGGKVDPEEVERIVEEYLTENPPAAGKDGYTPIKGIDYYTEADKKEMTAAVMADLADGLTLTDRTTGANYRIYVANGKLTMEEV